MAIDAPYDESKLINRLREGDERAFARIYEQHWPVLWQFAVRHLRDGDEAKDVLQEVFMALWQNRAVLDVHTSLSAYLRRATLNRVLKRADREKVIALYRDRLLAGLDVGRDSTSEQIAVRELEVRLTRGLDALPPKMREVFEASRLEGLTHEQIADKLGISKETVKSQIKNALKLLRRTLNSLFFSLF